MDFFSILFNICFYLYIFVQFAVPIVASFQDIKYGRVNNFLLWGGILLIIICHFVFLGLDAWTYIAGGIFTSLVFLLARVLTKGKLGLADVYFAGFAGVSLYWSKIWIFILVACASAGIFYFVRFSLKKNNNGKIPFIPFLSVGLIIITLLG